MTVPAHIEMHCDHRHWRDEFTFWQEQLGLWSEELQKALKNFDRLKGALETHERTLREHSAALGREIAHLDAHEHALAEYERGESGKELVAMAKEHRTEMTRQEKQRAIHERIKAHHHALLAQWELLFAALIKPM